MRSRWDAPVGPCPAPAAGAVDLAGEAAVHIALEATTLTEPILEPVSAGHEISSRRP
jgi:hypothetical protein